MVYCSLPMKRELVVSATKGAGNAPIPPPVQEFPSVRRRIASELRDATETLATLESVLRKLRWLDVPGATPLVDECEQIILDVREEIRLLGVDQS